MVNTSLAKVFEQIGLNRKHVLVYETLLKKTYSTPVTVARETKLNRSSLYRYLEDLRQAGLVELALSDKSSKYIARPDGLSKYLMDEEVRIEKLKNTIPNLVSELSKTYIVQSDNSEVKYFQGLRGLKQMLWNVVNTKSDFVGLGYLNWNDSVGKLYAEKLRQKIVKEHIKSRELLNEIDDNYSYTKIKNEYSKQYEHRSIDPQVLEIKHDTYIYDDVFAYYYHLNGEYFGVEIHNPVIAKTEKQIFEILWKMAK